MRERKQYDDLHSFHIFFLHFAMHKHGNHESESIKTWMFQEAFASFCYLSYQSSIRKNENAKLILSSFPTPEQLHDFGLYIRENISVETSDCNVVCNYKVRSYNGVEVRAVEVVERRSLYKGRKVIEGKLIEVLSLILAEKQEADRVLQDDARSVITAAEGRNDNEGKMSGENKDLNRFERAFVHPVTQVMVGVVFCAMAATAVYAIYVALTSNAGPSQWRLDEAKAWRELLAFGEKVASRRP